MPVSQLGVKRLRQLAPDQGGWLHRLSHQRSRRLTVQEVFQLVGYRGAAECFSMWCCLAASVKLPLLVGRVSELSAARRRFETYHGWAPHPLVLATDLCRRCD